MRSCKDTCDDQDVPRPPTGKTPVRNLRNPDEDWLPALAKTVADETTMTNLIAPVVREYGSTPPSRPMTFTGRPDALPWLDASYPAWRDCATAIAAAGLAGQEYAAVALWLALTRYPADRKQQKRIITGFVLLHAKTTTAAGQQERQLNPRALILAINGVLDEHLTHLPCQHERDDGGQR